MAGLAALMTRKKRDRRRELELKSHLHSEESFSEVVAGKEAQLQKKASNATINKLLMGKELMRQKSKSSEALSREYYDEDGTFKNQGQAYSSIYIGLVLICIGLVITFVGLGEKGFKTLELKLIGPVLCLIGLACILYKVLQCTFPKLFEYPSCFRHGNKLGDSDQSNLMEKGTQNGHFGGNSKKNSPQVLSPRVTLQSSKKSARPHSTIPNYIEDSSDEDHFDSHKSRPESNRYSTYDDSPSQESTETPVVPVEQKHYKKRSNNEVLLNPKTLML